MLKLDLDAAHSMTGDTEDGRGRDGARRADQFAALTDELAGDLSGVTDQAQRLSIATGILARAFEHAGAHLEIFSGGAAVAIYTGHDFGTRDIDVISPQGEKLARPLEHLGFIRRNEVGQIWEHADLRLIVQVAASEIRLDGAVYGGARERVQQALALRGTVGLDVHRARVYARTHGLGPQFEAFLALAERVDHVGSQDAARRALEDFWTTVDKITRRF